MLGFAVTCAFALSALSAATASASTVLDIFEGHTLLSPGTFVQLRGEGKNVTISGDEGNFSCSAPTAGFLGFLRYNAEKIDEIELNDGTGALAGEECAPFDGARFIFDWKLDLYASEKVVATDRPAFEIGECLYEKETLKGHLSLGYYNVIVSFGGKLSRSPESPKTCGKSITLEISGLDAYSDSGGNIWGRIESPKKRKEEE